MDKQERKIEKIVSGDVKTRKRSEASKLKDVFISDDARNVKSYIFMDVLIPAAKKAISDIVTNGIDMILYGESARPKNGNKASRVSYNGYYDRDRRDPRDYRQTRVSSYSYNEVVIANRGEAEDVLSTMEDIIDQYGSVKVSDLNEMVGITGQYTDNRYGWVDLRNARVDRVRDGYILNLPRALPLD